MKSSKRIMIDPENGTEIKMPKVSKGLINANIHNGPALYNLGTFELQRKNYDDALLCLLAAVKVDPNKESLINLSTVYKMKKNYDKSIKLLEDIIVKFPDFSLAYNNLGLLRYDQARYAEAKELYRKAIDLDPMYADAHWNLALAMGLDYFDTLARGNVASINPMLQEYEWRFTKTSPVNIANTIGTSQWDGSPLEGRKLMIVCEQGWGDMIMFLRYSYMFDPTSVILHLPEGMHCLVDPAYEVTNVTTVEHDVWIPMCSLLKYLQLGDGESYIKIDTKKELPEGFKIGIVWKGSTEHHNDHNRSMHYRDFLPLLKYGSVYSLQKGEKLVGAKDIKVCKINTWLDTAEYINAMDVVVTVDTSVAHLCGALGKRVLMLTPSKGLDWRWGTVGEKTPHYNSMTMVRNRDMNRVLEILDGS